MKAGKAYISSLGTTGLLIASSVLLLLVVGTIVAYDRWPHYDDSKAEDVALNGADHAVRARTVAAERRIRARARADRRRAAAAKRRSARTRGRAAGRHGRSGESAPAAEPVISDLPAPDSDGSPGRGGGGGGSAAGGPAGGGRGGGSGGGGGETTRQLGDAVNDVSPEAGNTIGGVGDVLDQAVGGGTAPPVAP